MEMCNREVVFKMTIMCSLKYVISLVPRLQKNKTVKKGAARILISKSRNTIEDINSPLIKFKNWPS